MSEEPFNPDWVSPPGDSIQNLIELRKLSIKEFAQKVGLSLYEVQLLLVGKYKIDKVLAEKLSQILGSSARFWLKREAQYRTDCKRLGKG
jgi:HTH-type transcriptional regulator/antitoxin HigA